MKNIINILLLTAVMISGTSCLSDIELSSDKPKSGTTTDVRLRLRTSGGFSSSGTRALAYADENTIDNVYVLVFDKDDKLVEIKKGEEVSDNTGSMTSPSGIYSGGGEFSVTLQPSTGVAEKSKSNLVVLVNAEEALDEIGYIDVDDPSYVTSAVGWSYDDIAANIRPGAGSALYATGDKLIPMWGETGQITIDPSATPEIALMRAVARVDVGLGDAAIYTSGQSAPYSWDGLDTSGNRIPFELRSINVVRSNAVHVVIPQRANRTTVSSKPVVSAPTIPFVDARFSANETEAAKFRYNNITNGLYSTQDIYVPEANILRGGTTVGDSNHKERMAIVVGGVYDANTNGNYTDDGDPTYYRLDFQSGGTLMNVLRNRVYQFNIQSVSDSGYPTVIEAYEANETKMDAEIIVWDDGGSGDHDFKGQYSLNVSQSQFEFSYLGGSLPIEFETDYPEISGPYLNSNKSPNYGQLYSWMLYGLSWSSADVDWMHFHEDGATTAIGFGYQPTFGSGTTNLDIVVKPNTSAVDRNVKVYVKAGNLTKIVTVTQPSPAVRNGGSANSNVISYIWHPGYPDHNTLTLTPDDGDDTNGITYVAYFKFGSLLAVSSKAATTTSFLANESTVIQWPEEWAATRADMEAKFTGSTAGSDTAAKVPRARSVYPGMSTSAPFPSLTYQADPEKGIGDPCAYWGEKYGWGDDYVLPSIDEWTAFTGANYNWIPPTSGTGTILDFGRGEFPLAPGGSVTLTAAGSRTYTGAGYNQGSKGEYWANVNNSYFTFDGTGARSSGPDMSGFAAVRCIQPVVATTLTVTPAKQLLEWDAFTENKSAVFDVAADGDWVVTTQSNANFTITRTSNGTGYNGTITVTPTSNNTATGVTSAKSISVVVAVPRNTALNQTVTVTQGGSGVRSVGNTPGIIGYYYNPGQPNHMQLTMDKDNGIDSDGIVFIAMFKYNSLVALSSQDNGDLTAGDVVAWPNDWAATTNYATDRAALEAKFSGAADGAAAFSIITASSTISPTPNPANALGDACAYYSQEFGGTWKMPTQLESEAFTGGSTGLISAGTLGYTPSTGNQPGLGLFIAGPPDPFGDPYGLPITGNRITNGKMTLQGDYGYYWTSTTRHFLTIQKNYGFSYSQVSTGTLQSIAKPIRCQQVVTPIPVVEVNGTFWATANVAAPGTFETTAEKYDAGNRYSFDDMDLNAICPTGWRLPTGQEYYDLFAAATNAGTPNGTMTPAGGGIYYGNPGFKTTSGGITGMQVDTPNGSLFFAASGYDDGANRDEGTGGFYLVSDGAQSGQDYVMYFVQAGVYPTLNFGSTIDKGSVRCVRN